MAISLAAGQSRDSSRGPNRGVQGGLLRVNTTQRGSLAYRASTLNSALIDKIQDLSVALIQSTVNTALLQRIRGWRGDWCHGIYLAKSVSR
jgi:hypothetical protein